MTQSKPHFESSSRLRGDLVRNVFEALSCGKSLIEVLIELDDISSFISILEGIIDFPEMPDNFKALSKEMNDEAKGKIIDLQAEKALFFEKIVEKYKDGTVDAVPLDLVDLLWLLMDEENLAELINLLPEGTRERQVENFLSIDLDNLTSEMKRNAIWKYRDSNVG